MELYTRCRVSSKCFLISVDKMPFPYKLFLFCFHFRLCCWQKRKSATLSCTYPNIDIALAHMEVTPSTTRPSSVAMHPLDAHSTSTKKSPPISSIQEDNGKSFEY